MRYFCHDHCDNKIFDGEFEIQQCDGSLCLETCRQKFTFSCNSTATGGVEADCKEVTISTTQLTSTKETTTTTSNSNHKYRPNVDRKVSETVIELFSINK